MEVICATTVQIDVTMNTSIKGQNEKTSFIQ